MPGPLTPHLTELREALEEDCPEYPYTEEAIQGPRLTEAEVDRLDDECPTCHGTGKYVRPEHQALYKLVVEPVEGYYETSDGVYLGTDTAACMKAVADTQKTMRWINSTGYTLRTAYWETAPDGALEGALVKALSKMMHGMERNETFKTFATLRRRILCLFRFRTDTRIAALEVVTRVVEDGYGTDSAG